MSYVSRSKSAAAEAERSEKLALELLEVFTRQPTQELRRLEMLSGLWTQVDQHINAVLEAANGREGTARMLCEFLVWRALNLWIDDDIQCGQTDAELLKEYRAKVEAAAAEPRPVRPMPMIDHASILPHCLSPIGNAGSQASGVLTRFAGYASSETLFNAATARKSACHCGKPL